MGKTTAVPVASGSHSYKVSHVQDGPETYMASEQLPGMTICSPLE